MRYSPLDLSFLYDQLREHMARLYAFCSIRSNLLDIEGDTEDEVDNIFVLLFRRDLLVFAATLRNFAESISLVENMKKIEVPDSEIDLEKDPPYFRDKKSSINFYSCISRILHSHNIQVHRTLMDYILATYSFDDLRIEKKIYEEEKKHNFDSDVEVFEPLIEMETERDGKYLVSLRNILKSASLFLDAALKILEKENIFLLRSFRGF
jgi:hypothetical protein